MEKLTADKIVEDVFRQRLLSGNVAYKDIAEVVETLITLGYLSVEA